jgi:phosphatidate cytidylyltransferase
MTRVLSGAALVLIAVAAVFFAPPWLFLLIAEAIVVLSIREYRTLASGLGVSAPWALAGAVAMLVCFVVATEPMDGPSMIVPLLMTAVVALGILTVSRWQGQSNALPAIAVALFPALYIGLPLGALVAIRQRHGTEALFLLMFTIMVSDTSQYYTGRLFGRIPLAAAVSPKKTVEGAVGGLMIGTAALVIAGHWWLVQPVPVDPLTRLSIGIAVVIAGIAGDLFESLLKRSAGVKDSSTLIPGHGGVLDRIDALLFAAPVYFVALRFL